MDGLVAAFIVAAASAVAAFIVVALVVALVGAITRHARRRTFRARQAGSIAPRPYPAYRFVTDTGRIFALAELSIAELRALSRGVKGFPTVCARDETGAWVVWPEPAMAGHVAVALAPPQTESAPAVIQRRRSF